MRLLSADFVTSAAAGGRSTGIPADGLGQIAIAGRSNVGKSTLLNALVRRKLARTSAAPGKTRLANIFRLTVEGGPGGPGRWSLYLVDLPGYGAAPNPRRDVSIADHAAVLARFLAGSNLRNPVLVGHSMGSQVVSRLAVDSPEVADHVVLMAPTMPPAERSSLWPGAWRLVVDGLWNSPRANAIVLTDYFFRCGIPYFLQQCPHLLGDRIEERLPRISAKTLVVGGDHDLVVPVEWARTVASLVPGATFRTVKGPHLVMFSDPVGIAAAIEEHVAS